MRSMKHRTAAGIGVLAVAASGFGALALSSGAEAAQRDGKCQAGEFCYNYNSNLKGSWSDFTSSVSDLGAKQPSCYEFKGAGAGKGQCVKNHAGGFWNRTNKSVTVYYNSGFGGRSATLKAGAKGKLPAAVYNENAGHRIGGGTPPPPSGSRNMSTALYAGGGGRLTCGFDGYTSQSGRHEGIDFAKGRGSSVLSLVNGQVIRVAHDSIGTIAIYVPSANKTVIYLHSSATIRQGATVKKGQKISTESNIGAGSMTHTHVEMRPGKQYYASKSVKDPVLNNPNPTAFWQSQGYRVK